MHYVREYGCLFIPERAVPRHRVVNRVRYFIRIDIEKCMRLRGEQGKRERHER